MPRSSDCAWEGWVESPEGLGPDTAYPLTRNFFFHLNNQQMADCCSETLIAQALQSQEPI